VETFFSFNLLRYDVTIFPVVEKILFEDADRANMHKIFFTTFAVVGNIVSCYFHLAHGLDCG
jgi:hypothetical protein